MWWRRGFVGELRAVVGNGTELLPCCVFIPRRVCMTISMYAASVPLLQRQLGALSNCLGKAEQHCEAKKIDPQALLQARLYPDMFHLTRQVQVAADMAKTCVARLAGAEPPKYEDNEASFADLRGRIGRTLDYVNGVSPAQ